MGRTREFINKGILAGAVLGFFAAAFIGAGSLIGSAATLPRDCEATAIIYCGATTVKELVGDYNSKDSGRYPDIPKVFAHFGIQSSDIQNLGKNYKMGKVKADGTVWVGNQLIGVNAVTAGRSKKLGSTAIPGTGAYTRTPSVSFARPSTVIDAFIGYKNGVPSYAILTSCGNPVTWDKPKIEIEKTVRSADNKKWVENDVFTNNSTLTYRIVVRNTGKAADKDIVVKDALPAGQSFVAGSVKLNGKSLGTSGNSIVGNGYKLSKLEAGKIAEFTFQSKIKLPPAHCGDKPFVNKARADGALTPPVEDTAGGKVKVVCVVIKCESLTASKGAIKLGEQITFTAKARVQHATIKSYEFRVDNKVVQDTVSNSYVLKSDKTGTFTVSVTVKTDKGNNTNLNCAVKINVNEVPKCPYNPQLPPNHPDCKKPEVCPYNPELPKDSPECKEAPEEPELPKTGAGSVIGLFAIVTLAAAAAHSVISRRVA